MYLKKDISKDLTVYRGVSFPYTSKHISKKRYTVVVGIGGNIADTKRRFEKLFVYMRRSLFADILKTSFLLKNPPFGYTDQDFFYNGIMVLKTDLRPKMFLRYLLNVEKKFRRKRSFKDAPRTLDLDIIFYEDEFIESKNLTIPHKDWKNRVSVILPLMDVMR